MPNTPSQSSTGSPGPVEPPLKSMFASSVEAGELLDRQAMSRSRSLHDERDLSDVLAAVAGAVAPTTEAVDDRKSVGPKEENYLRGEVLLSKYEAGSSCLCMEALELHIAALITDVKQLRNEHEDLNHVPERYGNTPKALPGLAMDVEEVPTLENLRLERLEAKVDTRTTA
ncbi:unnamed protein product [Agarophyton chilense]